VPTPKPWSFRTEEDRLGDRLDGLQTQAMVATARAARRNGLQNCLISAGLSSFGFPIVIVIDHRMRNSETAAVGKIAPGESSCPTAV